MTYQGRSGLQNERTALAWYRTAMALLAVSGLIGNLGLRTGQPAAALPGGCGVVLAVVLFIRARVRYLANRGAARAGRPVTRGGDFGLVGGGTSLLALLSLGLILVS